MDLQHLQRMAVNMQQIKNVGKASALDIKQFAYAGIDIYGLLADSMGITREEAAQLDVTYDMLSTALQKASNKLNESGASDKIGQAARMKSGGKGGAAGGAANASNAANAAEKANQANQAAEKAQQAQQGNAATEKKSSKESSGGVP